MKFNFKTLAAFVALSTAMTGCSKDDAGADASGSPLLNSTNNASSSAEISTGSSADEFNTSLAETDCTITFADVGPILFSGSGVSVTNNTVNIMKPGVYELSGSRSNCKIRIYAGNNAEVTLLFNNAALSSQNGSVINCISAKTLTLFSKDGTKNSLSDSANYSGIEDESDAAVFTRSDLVINGTGELSITGLFGDAVKSKDDIAVYNGTLKVSAVDDGITGKDSVSVYGGTVSVTAGGDGIKSTNDTDPARGNIMILGGELEITSEKDGIQAIKALTVKGGKITITAGGEAADAEVTAQSEPWDHDRHNWQSARPTQPTQSAEPVDTVSQKGMKAGGSIKISDGEINVKSADDSIHSGADVEISGGTLTLSSCDDGIHADEELRITNGSITVTKSYEGLEGKCVEIDGGVINIKAADDGINAAGGDNGGFFGYGQANEDYYIRISGGEITVDADGDGIDSNGTIAQSGGALTIFGPTSSGNGAIDYESSYAMSGGTLIAFGSQGMAQTPSTLSQPCLSISTRASANSVIEVRSGNKVILFAKTPKDAQSLIFSSDKLKEGTDYEIYVSDVLITTVTAEKGVSGNGGTGGGFPGGPGGFPGNRPNGGRFPGEGAI